MKKGEGRASSERRKGLAVIIPLSILRFRVRAVVGLRQRKKKYSGGARGMARGGDKTGGGGRLKGGRSRAAAAGGPAGGCSRWEEEDAIWKTHGGRRHNPGRSFSI